MVFKRPGRWQDLDFLLLIVVIILGIIGVATIHSATREAGSTGLSMLASRQLMYLIAGIITAVGIAYMDPEWLFRHAWKIALAVIILLLLVLGIGHIGHGAKRWINLGFITLQPSEFARPALILLLTIVWSKKAREKLVMKDLIIGYALCAGFALFIALEPDLGTAISLYPILLGMFLWSGAHWGLVFASLAPIPALILSQWWPALIIFVVISIIALRMAGISWKWVVSFGLTMLLLGFAAPYLWNMLKDYQQRRIMMFLDPTMDPMGSGYSLLQSMIAIGSGGVWGKGYLMGTQSHLRFLPESHSDFVFAVLGEEWGFIGSIILMLLFLFVILRGISVSLRALDYRMSLLAAGATISLLVKVMVNLGMVMGLLPVTGVPLPFITSGGSSLIADMVTLGFILNVRLRRYMF